MKFTQIMTCSIENCYAVSSLLIDNQLYAIFASSNENGHCYAFSGKEFEKKEIIWDTVGGTMSFVQIPGTNGEFVAVQHFFPNFNSIGAKLVTGKRNKDGKWIVNDLSALPYVHRFDLFNIEGEVFILAATLCGSKKYKDDWSDPGKVYVGKLLLEQEKEVQFVPILENLTKNHGYSRGKWKNSDAAFISSDEGVFAITIPEKKEDIWKHEQIIKRPVSDVAVCDLNNDGKDEIITIEPFHGDSIVVNELHDGQYRIEYKYPYETEFAHAVVACVLRGKKSIIGGIRSKNGELFIMQYDKKNGYESFIIDKGKGPSNVIVINQPERDLIICANNTINQGVIFSVTD